MKLEDLTGYQVGKLTAMEQVDGKINKKYPNKRPRTTWKCQCTCGNVVNMTSVNLKSGRVVGCGKCRSNIVNQYGRYNLKTYGSTFMQFYRTARRNASIRGLSFELGEQEVRDITKQNCHYCGNPPHQVLKPKNRFDVEFVYNGMDRVDNLLGYIPENVVPCCGRCNRAKLNLPVDQFKELIISIYLNWANK